MLIARWTALDARRARGVRAVVLLFAVVAVAAIVLPAAVFGDALSAPAAVTFLVAPLKVFVALTALLAGYGVVAAPRAGGQLALVLSLPVARTALVAGAFLGRAAVVSSGVVVGLVAASSAILVVYGELPLAAIATVGALSVLLAIAVTALAVGLSAAARTPGRAAVAAVAAFVAFEFFWGVVPAGLHYLFEGSLPGPVVPPWVVLVERLQPLSAFEATARQLLPAVQGGVQLAPGGAAAGEAAGARPLADRLSGPPPAYLDPRAGVVTLLGWTVAPLVAGWYRFARVDL